MFNPLAKQQLSLSKLRVNIEQGQDVYCYFCHPIDYHFSVIKETGCLGFVIVSYRECHHDPHETSSPNQRFSLNHWDLSFQNLLDFIATIS